jgi:hypothetical protein
MSSFAFSPGRDESLPGQLANLSPVSDILKSAFPHRVLSGDGQKRPIVSHLDQA